MRTTELTDIDGDALTITQRLEATWITCTKGKKEVTFGPVPTAAIRHAFQTPMGGDDMDGGVTAALIEKEAPTISPELLEAALAAALKDTRELTRERDDARGDRNDALRREKAEHERAVKAERERDNKAAAYDQLKILFGNAERAAISWKERAQAAESRLEQARPLTADDITDAMVKRAVDAWMRDEDDQLGPALRAAITAALTEPPARTDAAEAMDNDLRAANAAALGGALDPQGRQALADHLAAMGYRKATPAGSSTGPHLHFTPEKQS